MSTTTKQTASPTPIEAAPSRALWKGTITFGMLAVPVRVLAATRERDITFTSVHKGCGAQLKQHMRCPVHADADIAIEGGAQRAYEVAKDTFVAISDEDMAQLPEPTKQVLSLDCFVDAKEVPHGMFEKTYYLQPDQVGLRPFSLLATALSKRKRVAIGRITLRTRERLCLVRPEGDGLVLVTLLYPEELRAQPAMPTVLPPQRQELQLAMMLIDAKTEAFDMAKYPDTHRAAVLSMVERALAGSGAAAAQPAAKKPAANEDLMAQLRASVEAAKAQKGSAA